MHKSLADQAYVGGDSLVTCIISQLCDFFELSDRAFSAGKKHTRGNNPHRDFDKDSGS